MNENSALRGALFLYMGVYWLGFYILISYSLMDTHKAGDIESIESSRYIE